VRKKLRAREPTTTDDHFGRYSTAILAAIFWFPLTTARFPLLVSCITTFGQQKGGLPSAYFNRKPKLV